MACRGRVRAEAYIDFGEADANKALFDRLRRNRDALEQAFGEPLSWEWLDERRASRIAVYCPGSIDASPEELTLCQHSTRSGWDRVAESRRSRLSGRTSARRNAIRNACRATYRTLCCERESGFFER